MSVYYLETAYLLKVPIPYKKKLTLLKIATWGFWGWGVGKTYIILKTFLIT